MKTLTVLLSCSILLCTASPNGRIIGGSAAMAGQFPFAAAIYKSTAGGTYFCAGTLYTNQWIITSGQCVEGATLFSIRLGANSLTSSDALRLATDTYYLHPDFDPLTLDNDIGIIELRLPITFTTYIQSVHYIADFPINPNSPCATYGWGQTSDENVGLTDHLQQVSLVSLSNEECRLTFGNQITDNMVCVAGNNNQGTCVGDLGGGLIQYASRGITYLAGVSSFISGNGCESSDPSGFTRVSPYAEWIRNVTGGTI